MGENEIFCTDGLNARIQQKKEESLLKWLNIILYPRKHGYRHQKYFDTMDSDWDIDKRRMFRNGGLLHIGGIVQGWQSGIIEILKEHTSEVQQNKLYGRYCKVLQKSGVWQPG